MRSPEPRAWSFMTAMRRPAILSFAGRSCRTTAMTLLQLARLLKVVSKTDFHKAMFHLGFPVCGLNVEKIGISGSIMTVSGSQRAEPFDYTGFSFGDYPAEIRFSRRDSDFHIKFPVIRDSGLVIADLDAAGRASPRLRDLSFIQQRIHRAGGSRQEKPYGNKSVHQRFYQIVYQEFMKGKITWILSTVSNK